MATFTFARNETKYLLAPDQLEGLMGAAGGLLVPDAWGPTTVRSLYCDTPTRLLVRRSCEAPRYKEKIRIRSYRPAGPDDEVFLELKKKCDGVTYKRRAAMTLRRALAFVDGRGDPATQIERELDFAARRYEGLAPVTLTACERQAFLGEGGDGLRLTFDRGIRYRDCGAEGLSGEADGTGLIGDGMCLLEVKCGDAMPLWLARALAGVGARRTGFSKYGRAWQDEVARARAAAAPQGIVVNAMRGPAMAPAGRQAAAGRRVVPATRPVTGWDTRVAGVA